MEGQRRPDNHRGRRFAWMSAIFLSFIVAFEVAIMISPFALFFYAVFDPFLLALSQSSMTRWLTAFFLPHMIVPPNEALTVVRILGSVFFVGGMLMFLVCAGQVYLGKLLKKGIATKGLYTLIRHPQYLGLGLAALGLAIIWPRFLTLALLAVMLFLYYLLAKDEERRMINRFGESYNAYMNRTGMFLPHFIERALAGSSKPQQRLGFAKAVVIFLVLLVATVGSGFILRAYTVHHLPLEQVSGVDVITITREDLITARQLIPSVLQDPAIGSKLRPMEKQEGHRVLAYFIPIDYVMQGMVANTGHEWKLFEHHKTVGMIIENVFHPFAHITGGRFQHAVMAAHAHHPEMYNSPAMKRRIIFIELSDNKGDLKSPLDDFNINVKRAPLFFVDVHLHTGEILQTQNTLAGSGWGTVPTPMF